MLQPYSFNSALWIPYLSLILLGLIVKPSPYRRLLFLPIPPLTAYVLLSTTGAFITDYFLGLSWLPLFWFASDYILLTEVQRTLRQRANRTTTNGVDVDKEQSIETASIWRRTRWAVALLLSPRGVGWAHEPTTVLPARAPAGTSRAAFVVQSLRRALMFFIIHDACNLHVRWNPMFHADGPGWRADGLAWRAVVVMSWGLGAYTSLLLRGTLLGAVCVACGVSEPEEWPPLLGPLGEAYTIRKFWGRVWHQIIRRFVTTHGKFLAHRVLKLRPGTNPSAYVQLYTAFAISAALHYAAETMALRSWHGGALVFFMLQACAITLEDFLIFVGWSAGIRGGFAMRMVGYAWVCAWFTVTLPVWEEPLVSAGLMHEGLSVSVLLGLWRGEWVLPPLSVHE